MGSELCAVIGTVRGPYVRGASSADIEPANALGRAAAAQVAFRKSRNSLREIMKRYPLQLLCRSSTLQGRDARSNDLLHEHVGDLRWNGPKQRVHLTRGDGLAGSRIEHDVGELGAKGPPVEWQYPVSFISLFCHGQPDLSELRLLH